MSKFLCLAALSLIFSAASAAELTPLEQRWLKAAAPVLAYAKQMRLPVDIVLQPQAGPDDVPLAMGFDGDRCKMVLSLRGNSAAEEVLQDVAPEARALMIETMAAHEMGHCWRYAQGDWHVLPTGFVDAGEAQSEESIAMRDARREEGFSDLVALAWIQKYHPAQYGQVYAWIEKVRNDQSVAGGSHDTRSWIGLARDGAVFAGNKSPFEQVRALWSTGLKDD